MKNKQQKKKQREERIRQERHLNGLRSLYPKFVFFNERVVSPEYARAVRRAVSKINFQTFKFTDGHGDLYDEFLKDVVKYGYKYAFSAAADVIGLMRMARIDGGAGHNLNKLAEDEILEFNRRADEFACKHEMMVLQLGDNILESDRELFMRFYPEYGFRICFVNDCIAIVFQRIFSHFDTTGKYLEYMIPRKVEFGGKGYNLCFKHHALNRIRERFSTDSHDTYASYILLYEFFQHMLYRFKKVRGVNYLQFYFPMYTKLKPAADRIFEIDKDIRTIDGQPRPLSQFQYYVKAFLSPFDVEGDRLHVITALLPGFHPTPEFYAHQDSSPAHMKERDKVRHSYFSGIDINSTDYHDAMVFFHRVGIPQVFAEPVASKNKNPFFIRSFFEMPCHMPDHMAGT